MASYYGLLFHEYWTGPTGQRIAAGGEAALLLGTYLLANRSDNMLGLYRLPLPDVTLPLSRPKLEAALTVLHVAEFADYDYASQYVWVREMARFRLGLRDRQQKLQRKDNRVAFINALYSRLDDNPFLAPFYDRYGAALHLRTQRTSARAPQFLPPARSPLRSPSQAPPKPVRSTYVRTSKRSGSDQEQGRRSEIRDQKKDLPPLSRRPERSKSSIKQGIRHDGPTAGAAVAATVRDRAAAADGGADDRQRGVGGPHQGSAHPIGFHLPGAAGGDSQREADHGPTPAAAAADADRPDAAGAAGADPTVLAGGGAGLHGGAAAASTR